MLENFLSAAARIRLIGGLLTGLATGAIPLCQAWSAEASVLHLRCTNPVGGATWSVVVDLEHNQVDSLPASISDAWIKWNNGSGGIYELERATGKLQLRAPSTTGGFFLHYTCQRE